MRNFVLLVVVLFMVLGCVTNEPSEDPRCLQTQDYLYRSLAVRMAPLSTTMPAFVAMTGQSEASTP